MMRSSRGDEVQPSFNGAPMRSQDGNISEAVATTSDVTERRSREVLGALLAMAEVLVDIPAEASASDEQAPGGPRKVARRLAELASRVLGCKRLSITAIEPQTERLRLVAVYGLSPEQEQQIWGEQQQREMRLADSSDPLVSRLRAKEVQQFDMTQPPLRDRPNPYGVRTVLIVPMSIEDRLVGFLSLDHAGAAHNYSAEERAVAQGVAHFAALVLERQRLLGEYGAAQARELVLREANERMDAFLGIASHELRTPLTSVIGNVQMAERQFKQLARHSAVSQEEMAGNIENACMFLADARRQLWRLNRLVDELLNISRIQAKKLTLRREICDLVSIVQEAVEELRQVNPARHIGLEVRAGAPVPVLVDADRIGQVVANYLTNALKYAPAQRPIAVELQVKGQSARVSVQDEGPGLPLKEWERIWERFYRVPGIEVQSGSHVGLGLGLHICRALVEQHEGQVGVQSTPGHGSTFWFILPLAQQDQRESLGVQTIFTE